MKLPFTILLALLPTYLAAMPIGELTPLEVEPKVVDGSGNRAAVDVQVDVKKREPEKACWAFHCGKSLQVDVKKREPEKACWAFHCRKS